jgi:hypothetical protein
MRILSTDPKKIKAAISLIDNKRLNLRNIAENAVPGTYSLSSEGVLLELEVTQGNSTRFLNIRGTGCQAIVRENYISYLRSKLLRELKYHTSKRR